MTLQQLRYLIAIAEHGSINAAASKLYASQSTLSVIIKDLEQEFGITIFNRSNRGVTLTNDGTELLSYARQVVEQADMLEARYHGGDPGKPKMGISTQHYAFSVRAFVNFVEKCSSEEYDFIMRETATGEIIDDVRTFRSHIGILYLDSFNKRALTKAFAESSLQFTPLFEVPVHIFVGEHHPLAKNETIKHEELEPWPRYSFEQGTNNSFYYSEEPLSYLPHKRIIRISDRATLTSLLTDFDGYTVATGVLTPEMQSGIQRGIVSIPLETDEKMTVGYLIHKDRKPNELMESYLKELKAVIRANGMVKEYSGR